ncbi:hypothetical protein BOTBODRAFT_62960 [Botryobasidium botryosum FD-172 SS1]|uniref:Uncharacterized protein n=1 Tax=Botryobasidium botryosum (strain FD-172 SS1) TaxID=930990 RepID=A0A067MV94_BOTB1|nr:hypothetical protein BOTBODRAFT_62960 [Botryobasidium botryosum FD-172 SS1]
MNSIFPSSSASSGLYSSLFTSGLIQCSQSASTNTEAPARAAGPPPAPSSLFLQIPTDKHVATSPARRASHPRSPRKRRSSITTNISPLAGIKSPTRAAASSAHRVQGLAWPGRAKENDAPEAGATSVPGFFSSKKLWSLPSGMSFIRSRRKAVPALRKPAPTAPLPPVPAPRPAADSNKITFSVPPQPVAPRRYLSAIQPDSPTKPLRFPKRKHLGGDDIVFIDPFAANPKENMTIKQGDENDMDF